jgi:uncharacterized tellurite resistance protein B-like protein
MINAIKQFFEVNISTNTLEDNEHHRLKLATAALMVEIMQQDGETKTEELVAIKTALQSKFDLNENETHELVNLATQQSQQAVDLFQFTSLIHKNFSPEKKIKIIEYLWTVAYSDDHLDPHEEHLIRRIADLLYVSHKDLIQTKHRVLETRSS